jgi:ABC-type transporter Mla subunit MlaD
VSAPHRNRDFALGLTAIGAIGGMAGLLLAFGKLQPLLARPFTVVVETNTAAGIRPGGLVTLHGVPVGEVRRVLVDPAWDPPVHIELGIDRDAKVPAGVQAMLSESLIGGGNGVDLTLPAGAKAGELLAPQDPPFALRATFAPMTDRLALALGSAQRAFAAGASWLDDEALRSDARGAVKRANQLFDEATDTVQIVGNLAHSVQADASRLAASLQRTADALAGAMARVDDLLRRTSKGEGTAGKLLADPALYDNLTDSAQRLKAALEQANLLLKQIREKGLQLQVP